jgi:PAS domain S-box-containing protein
MATLPQEQKSALYSAELIIQINSAISKATSEHEILARVGAYAGEHGATSAVLSFSETDATGKPIKLVDVATWSSEASLNGDAIQQLPISPVWVSSPNQVVFIQDYSTDTRLDASVKEMLSNSPYQGILIMPLHAVGRWQGLVSIYWLTPHAFTPEEVYVYNALFQTVAASVANRRAYTALDKTRRTAEIVARINASLVQATNEQEILDAVAVLVEEYNVELSTMNYVHYNAHNEPDIIETVAIQSHGQPVPLTVLPGGTRYPRDQFTIQNDILASNTPFFMENVFTDPRSEPGLTRAMMKASNISAVIVLPLRSGDRWQGTFTFSWPEPQVFPPELREILIAVTPTAAAVVTNRRLLTQTERLYQITEERLRIVVNNTPIVLFTMDKEGKFTLAEGAGLRDYDMTSGELIGQNVFDFYKGFPEIIDYYRRALAGEEFSAVFEVNERAYQTGFSPIVDETGALAGTISVSIDVTDRVRAEAERERLIRQLREASRFKDEFLAMMSHELRTPLNAMIGLLGISLMKGTLDEQNKLFVQRARANSERLLNLINNILDISRMEAGRLEIVSSPVSLKEMVEKLRHDMSILAEQKKLQFSTHVDESLPDVILTDEDALNKIFTNLIGNAFKFTQEGSVSLEVLQQDTNLVIKVTDTGIGIPIHMQQIIFESFRQVDASSTRVHGGSGLGLAIVHNLCVAMGGNVRVESKPNEGSTFVVTLPLNTVDVQAQN